LLVALLHSGDRIEFKLQGQGKGISGLWMTHGCCCPLVFDHPIPVPALFSGKVHVLLKVDSLSNSSCYQRKKTSASAAKNVDALWEFQAFVSEF
jgi:hypothetical protein